MDRSMTEMDPGVYAAIVEEAKSRGFVDPETTPLGSGEEVIAAAKMLLEAAKDAYGKGARGEDVLTFLRMGGIEVDGAQEPPPPDDAPEGGQALEPIAGEKGGP